MCHFRSPSRTLAAFRRAPRGTVGTILVVHATAWLLFCTAVTAVESVNEPEGMPRELRRAVVQSVARDAVGGDSWVEAVKLTASDGGASLLGDRFGFAVALSGDTALVGAGFADVDGIFTQGAAYVFVRSGNDWSEQAKLVPSDGAQNDQFGTAVALSGDTALIGARIADVDGNVNQGAAYVFTRSGETWSEQTKLTASDGAEEDQFGWSVTLVGDTAMVGAIEADVEGDVDPGAVYVFARSGEDWNEEVKLAASDGVSGDKFGISVTLSDDILLVGASWAQVDGKPFQGTAYVFVRDGEGWSEQAKLTASDGAELDQFGEAVALSGNTALIGALAAVVDGNDGQGAAYVFTRDGEVWSEQAKLVASDGVASDGFGHSVALSEDVALVSALGVGGFQGAAYVFTRDGETWSEQAKLTASDGAASDNFGDSVAMSDGIALIGAPGVDVNGNGAQGATYVFIDLPDSVGTLEGTVRSLRCGDDTVPLEGATVEILGQQETYTLTTDEHGYYRIFLDELESPLDIMVGAPGHFPAEVLNVELSGGDVVVQDFDLVLEAPCATTDPAHLSLTLGPDQSTTESLTVGNLDGAAELLWEIATAEPTAVGAGAGSVRGIGGVVDCENEPGIVIHDDGSVENGYTGSPAASHVMLVDRFVPVAYPASLDALCVAFVTTGPTSLDFDIVVFDDDGPDGGPGSELGVLPASAEGIPGPDSLPEPAWLSFDTSSLGITVDAGSVYVGVRWVPANPGVFLAADESTDRPPGFAGGHWWNEQTGTWVPIEDISTLPQYRSLFVRVVADPGGCLEPGAVGWLSVDPTSGSVPAGDSDTVAVHVDSTGLAAGDYTASLCIQSNDPVTPLLVVPVGLVVTEEGDEELTPTALTVDAEESDGNGVFEPGEQVEAAPAWRNDGDATYDLAGTASAFTGPEGASYTIVAPDADYGLIEPGQSTSCRDTGVCYQLGLDDPAVRPATHWEATFDETLDDSDGTTKTWTLHIGESFADVPPANLFYPSIETLLHSGVTGGCVDDRYCPDGVNARSQMPVFVLRAVEGADYVPEDCVEGEEEFADVPFDNPFCRWIEELAHRDVVSGCGDGNYCPTDAVTRAQMAIFLLRSLEGGDYTPPTCSGTFEDVPCPSLFADWIEDLAAREITGGCSANEYCPGDPVSRAQMAVFVTRTFGLTLYGP